MTALFKIGDTIYQRTVKLNVRGLTEPRGHGSARSRSAGDVTCSAARAGEQRMQLRLVQVRVRGRRQLQVGRRRARAEEDGSMRRVCGRAHGSSHRSALTFGPATPLS